MRAVVPMLAVAALTVTLLTACSSTVSLDAAEDATDPVCASVVVRLPEILAEGQVGGPLPSRETDAQATGAWGDPASVTLRCGVPVPAPSTAPCLTIEGIDWIDVSEEGSEVQTFVTYGRVPATEVVLDPSVISGGTVLEGLGSAVSVTEEVGACLAAEDAPTVP